jgi:pyruvate dehydrogenase E1 component beta subunit
VVDEGYRYCGFGSEIVAFVVENAMDALRQPPRQLTTMHTTIPFSPPMEDYVFPNPERIAAAVRGMIQPGKVGD